MKHYLFFIGTVCNGGAERVVSILASQMAKQGLDVEILTYYDMPPSYEIDKRVKLSAVETLSGKKNKLANLRWLRAYLKDHAKVVISFLAPFNMMAIAATMGTKVPILVADRNDPARVPSNPVLRKFRDFLYRFAAGIVVQTEKNKAYFSRAVQKKSRVIYNPVDLKDYAGIARNLEKEKKIVTAGRLMPQKNQKMMIEAFDGLLKTHPDYELVIFGEGPSRGELEALADTLGIKDHVFLPGNVTDIYDRIKRAEVFVLSSDYEGMPNALIEAMCLGIPCISTKVSGATDLITDHENGLLTETGDREKLEQAMRELICDRALAETLAENAVKLNEELKVSKMMQQWIDFINEIAD